MSGEMRRPPQLWEQRLARTTAILGVGISSSGDTTSIVPPTPVPGTDGGVEPAPVLPAPGVFKTPSTPTLSGTVQGIRVSWNGLNSDGDPYPTGAYVEVHISTTGATFTPDATTLAGTLLGSAGFFTIGALTAGTTYYVRLVGVDDAGNKTSPSTAASSQTGLTTSSDYGTATIGTGAVSFNARQIGGVTSTVGTATPTSPVVGDIWLDTTGGATTHKRWNGSTWETILFGSGSIATSAITSTKIADDAITTPKIAANAVTAAEIAANTITASQIAANTITATNLAAGAVTAGAIAASAVTTAKLDASAVTADKIAASAITADKIAANAVTAAKIDANAVTSAKIEATALDSRTITGSTIRTASSGNRVTIDGISEKDRVIWYNSSNNRFSIYISGENLIMDATATGVFRFTPDVELDNALVNTSTSVPNLRINTDTGVVKQTTHANSAQRFKHDIIPLSDEPLAEAVDATLIGDAMGQAVDPLDVLSLVPVQYRRNESPTTVVTGFIAEDVEAKFPTAATYDESGVLEAIDIRSIVAGLLAVAQQQQATIADLTARIEALEA